jgi:hypothetical protein
MAATFRPPAARWRSAALGVVTLQAENYPELGFWGGFALSPDDRGFALRSTPARSAALVTAWS